MKNKRKQRGNFFIGLIIGAVVGLGAALAVAIYVAKVPVPFLSKNQRTAAAQDETEARRNRDWNPNAPLAGRAPTPAPVADVAAPDSRPEPVVAPPSQAQTTPPVASTAPVTQPRTSDDPLGDWVRAKANDSDPFLYYVQVGAFRTGEDAEAQRAKLSLMGVEAQVAEHEQAGRSVFRVRAGPFEGKGDADKLRQRLANIGLEAALVRAQR